MPRRWLFALALVAAPAAAPAADATVVKGKEAIEFKAGTESVAKYQFAGTVPDAKGGDKPLAKPFLFPLTAPGGLAVTAFGPSDHPHQKSVWFCHGNVIPEGLELKVKASAKDVDGVDFWTETLNHGRIVCVEVGEPVAVGPGHVKVATRNEWRSPDGVKILDEDRTLHFHDLPAGRLFVFECKLTASVCPITFGDTKEGSFGVRVNQDFRTLLPAGGTVTAADGTAIKAPAKEPLSVWGQPADWHDYSGTVDGKAAGVAAFDDPKNPGRAAWHTRAYGLMAANPFGRARSGFPSQKGKTELVTIEKGKSLTFRYAVYAHVGDATVGKVAEAYEAFKK